MSGVSLWDCAVTMFYFERSCSAECGSIDKLICGKDKDVFPTGGGALEYLLNFLGAVPTHLSNYTFCDKSIHG